MDDSTAEASNYFPLNDYQHTSQEERYNATISMHGIHNEIR